MGRGMLSPDSTVDSRGRRVGPGPGGTRPMSTSSTRSGTSYRTIYHDAQSTTPGTPLSPSLPWALDSGWIILAPSCHNRALIDPAKFQFFNVKTTTTNTKT